MKKIVVGIIVLVMGLGLSVLLYNLNIEKNINNNYGDFVITNKDATIYKVVKNKLINSGNITKDVKLKLNGKYHKKYFKIDNTNYYIKYNNVKKNNKDNTSINNYISNKKVNIKDKTKLYSDSNSYIELNDNIKLDLLSEKDDKYYVRFNNSIYYIYNNENVSINDNQDYIESADYVSILYFDNIEKSNMLQKQEYLKNNNYINISINDYELWRRGIIDLPKKSVLVLVKDYFDELSKYKNINNLDKFSYKLTNNDEASTRNIDDIGSNYIINDETSEKQFNDMLMGENIINGPVATQIAVLNYHFFYDKSSDEWCNEDLCLDIKDFEEELVYLKDNGYKTLTMEEFRKWMYGEIDLPEKSVLLTIDDGAKGTDTHLIRLLEKYDMHGTLFLITAWWPKEKYTSKNLEIESHGYDIHYSGYCSGVMRGAKGLCISSEELFNDLNKSIDILNTNIAFCFPFYAYNNSAIDVVKNAGFKLAFIGGNRKATRDDDKYKIPRYPIYKQTTLSEFIDMIS